MTDKTAVRITLDFLVRSALVDTYDLPRSDFGAIAEAIVEKLYGTNSAKAVIDYAKERHIS